MVVGCLFGSERSGAELLKAVGTRYSLQEDWGVEENSFVRWLRGRHRWKGVGPEDVSAAIGGARRPRDVGLNSMALVGLCRLIFCGTALSKEDDDIDDHPAKDSFGSLPNIYLDLSQLRHVPAGTFRLGSASNLVLRADDDDVDREPDRSDEPHDPSDAPPNVGRRQAKASVSIYPDAVISSIGLGYGGFADQRVANPRPTVDRYDQQLE